MSAAPPKPQPTPIPAAAPPVADIGDEVYYRHPVHQVTSGKVIAHGQHGATCRHADGETHQVLWDDLLGHRQRRQRAFTVIDQGEDGAIVADEDGKRHFLAGGLPAPEEELPEDEPTEADPEAPLAKSRPLLVDLGPLSCGCTDHALETLHKAQSEDQADIWAPHENPWIRELIERLTAQGLQATEDLGQAVMAWLAGSVPIATPAARPDLLAPWTADLHTQVLAYLRGKPQETWLASDWSLLVDYLIRQFLPGETLRNALTMASQQGGVLGAVSAAIKLPLTPTEVVTFDTLLQAASQVLAHTQQAQRLAQAVSLARLNQIQMDYAQAHCAELVVDFTDQARRTVKRIVLEQAKQATLAGVSPATNARVVEQSLRDTLGALNRDWRRIALTEVGEAHNQGFVATLPPGAYVRRIEAYQGACNFCRKIDGAILKVVSPEAPEKDWDREVWIGKSNQNRSGSPRKRVGDALVERTDSELWKIPAGLVHPHCRGLFVAIDGIAERDDLTRWLFEEMGTPAEQPAAPAVEPDPKQDFAAWVQWKLQQSRPATDVR